MLAIPLDPLPREAWLPLLGNQRGNMIAIAPILLSKPPFEFLVFQSNHNYARGGSERGQNIKHSQPGTDTPSQHLAEMSQVDRMPDAGSDSRDYQPLFAVRRQEFSRTAELRTAEVLSGTFVKP